MTTLLIIMSMVIISSSVYADKLELGSPTTFIIYGLPYFVKLTDDVTGNDVLKHFSLGDPTYLCFYSECTQDQIIIKVNNLTAIDSSILSQYAQDALGWYCFPVSDMVVPNTSSLSTFTFECGPNEQYLFSYGLYYNRDYNMSIRFDKSIGVLDKKLDNNLEGVEVYYLNVTPDQSIKLKVIVESSQGNVVDPSIFTVMKGEFLNLKNGKYSFFTASLCDGGTGCIEYDLSMDNSWLYKEGYLNIFLSTTSNPLTAQYVVSKTIKIVPKPLDIKLYFNNKQYDDKNLYVSNDSIYIKIEPIIYSGTVNDINRIIVEFYDSNNKTVNEYYVNPNENTEIIIPNTGLSGKVVVKVLHNNGLTYTFSYPFKTFSIKGLTKVDKNTYFVGETIKGYMSLEQIYNLNYTLEGIYFVNSSGKVVDNITNISTYNQTINFTYTLPFSLNNGDYKIIINVSVTSNDKKLYLEDIVNINVNDYGDDYKIVAKCRPSSKISCDNKYDFDSDNFIINVSLTDPFDISNLYLILLNVGKDFSMSELEILLDNHTIPSQLISWNNTDDIERGEIFGINITIYPAYIKLNNFSNAEEVNLIFKVNNVTIYTVTMNMNIRSNMSSIDIVMDDRKDIYYSNNKIRFNIVNLPSNSPYIIANITLKSFKMKSILQNVTKGYVELSIPREILKEGHNDMDVIITLTLFDKKIISKTFKEIKVYVVPSEEYEDKIIALKTICNCYTINKTLCNLYLRNVSEAKSLGVPIPIEIINYINENRNCNSQSKSPSNTSTLNIDEMVLEAKKMYKALCETHYDHIMEYVSTSDVKTELSDFCHDYEQYYHSNLLTDEKIKMFYEAANKMYEKYEDLFSTVKQRKNIVEERKNIALIVGIVIAVLVVIGVAIVVYKSIPKERFQEDFIDEDYY